MIELTLKALRLLPFFAAIGGIVWLVYDHVLTDRLRKKSDQELYGANKERMEKNHD